MDFCVILSLLCCVRLYYSEARSLNLENYEVKRRTLVSQDRHEMIGSGLILNSKEQAVSDYLLEEKRKVFESARVNSTVFPPSESFFKTKNIIEASPIFHLIQRMPKGGALHVHDSALMDPMWLVKNASYRSDLYMCYTASPSFHFYKTAPQNNTGCEVGWEPMSDIRGRQTNVSAFDQRLYENLTLFVPNPDEVYFDQNQVWNKFQSIFFLLGGIFNYEPVFRDYVDAALNYMVDDNVMYVEIRALLSDVYNLDGSVLAPQQIMEIYDEEFEKFVSDHPNFIKPKIIYTQLRFLPVETIQKAVEAALALRKRFPGTFVGFDLVAQEDTLNTLQHYIEPLLYPSSIGASLNYYFHAGETDFQGTQVDGNLFDALLLNTSRIGHGYALSKHPELMEQVRKRDIALEVNPLSNQLLMLVKDLRDHPASTFFSSGMPVVVSSDDPALFTSLPLSHDFYAAFMAFTGEKGDLRTLKQLALNSFKYAALSSSERKSALKIWTKAWNSFIDDIIAMYNLKPVNVRAMTTPKEEATSSSEILQCSVFPIIFYLCVHWVFI